MKRPKSKNRNWGKLFYTKGSQFYDPENDLLWLGASEQEEIDDIREIILKDGFLRENETFRGKYKGNYDMPVNLEYKRRKARDLTEFQPWEM